MKAYLLKRILFSIFSLFVVIMIVMLLVYSLIDRKVIFQTDDVWNKKFLNDRTAYEYSQYEKFGYMDTVKYGAFIKERYQDVPDYEKDPQYIEDVSAINQNFKFLESDAVAAFIDKYGYLELDKFESFIYEFHTQKKKDRLSEITARIKEIEAMPEYDITKALNKELKKIKSEKPTLEKELETGNYDKDKTYTNDLKQKEEIKKFLSNESVYSFVETYTKKGFKISYLEPVKYSNGRDQPGGTGQLYAIKDRIVFLRLWDYVKGLFTVETVYDVKDPNLTDRYIRVENDPNGWFAVVGSGTTHKYLLYFDDRFPFIHQNFLHLNLGVSHTRYRGDEISAVITQPQGSQRATKVVFPTGVVQEHPIDIHSLTYSEKNNVGDELRDKFDENDHYVNYKLKFDEPSRLENSFIAGIISTIIAYAIGLPLGILMARKKDTIIDHLGNVYIIFIMSVPSLAYIFMFAVIGTTVFKLPYQFANASPKMLGYILPIISLALPSIGGLMKWMRRHMIDQMNSDYVKFARSQGLSEREIYRTHISRNAMIFIVSGIPGSILGSLTGAIITERVYGFPGVGNLLTEAINRHDNSIIVATTVFYTTITIASIILGDLLLAKYDPRISLSSSKGGGR